MRRAALACIRFYQRAISPGLPAACRFQPTCSHYAYEAVERYGILHGGWMAAARLLRCVPWRPGGYDPVPDRTDRTREPRQQMHDNFPEPAAPPEHHRIAG